MKKILFLEPAKFEMIESAEFYEQKSKGLGKSFLSSVRKATQIIKRDTLVWPIVDFEDQIRRYILKRFPYAILYRDEIDKVIIIAVMHMHREPYYWKNRIITHKI